MRTIEATRALDPILEELQKGEPLEIRRHDVPVAVVYPVAQPHPGSERVHEVIEGLRKIRSRNTLGGISIKSLIEEGRP